MGRGVLRPDLAASVLRLDRHKPTDALAPFVDYYWIPRWDLRGRPPHEQTVLPHPNVHLVFEASGAGIFGVDRRLFTRSLSGLGLAFGIRFTAGGFRPFWQAPISQLTDRVVPAARLFGPRAEKTRQAIMDDFTFGGLDVDDGVMIGYAEALLHSVLPEPDPLAGQAAALVSRITEDPALRRVDQLSASSGLTVRTLQRLFADYVGVSPKWVMRRARLHDAAERADSGEPVDWAALASDLGYADQAHLTRDFTVTIGVPPARYAAAPLPGCGGRVLAGQRSSGSGRGGAPADDEPGRHGDGPLDIVSLQQPEHHLPGEHTLLTHGLAYRGQVGQLGKRVIIDANDRDVLRNAQPGPAQRAHGAEGDFVGVRVDGRGRLAQSKQFAHGLGTLRAAPVHGGDEAGISGDAGLAQSRVVGLLAA